MEGYKIVPISWIKIVMEGFTTLYYDLKLY